MAASRTGLAAACALAACGAAQGDFSGPYAPDLWTFTPGPGGSIDSHIADELKLRGGDIGFSGDTDLTIAVLADGIWSFHWAFAIVNSSSDGFDLSYYLVNGEETLLSDRLFDSGDVSVNVQAGDSIGYRVSTVDGLFGPGLLTITNFTAPVPGPGAIAFVLPLLIAARRRRRAPTHSRSSP